MYVYIEYRCKEKNKVEVRSSLKQPTSGEEETCGSCNPPTNQLYPICPFVYSKYNE